MIATALLVLATMGVVMAWIKQLPAREERLADLSPRRKLMTVLAIPVSLGGVVMTVPALRAALHLVETEGGYAWGVAATVCCFLVGCACLLGVAIHRTVWRGRRHQNPAAQPSGESQDMQ